MTGLVESFLYINLQPSDKAPMKVEMPENIKASIGHCIAAAAEACWKETELEWIE